MIIYPNPSNHTIKFEIENKFNEDLLVQIINYQGQVLLSNIQKNKELDISHLSKGSYIITVQSSQYFYSSQFIKK